MASKGSSNEGPSAILHPESGGSVDASTGEGGARVAEAADGTVPAKREQNRSHRAQRVWENAGNAGMRAKAGFETRALSGAMLRLTRVMKNR